MSSPTAGGHPPAWRPRDDPELAPSRDPQRAIARVAALPLGDAEQERHRDLVLSMLERDGAAVADRRHHPAHLTASALVLDAAGRHVVLLLHAKLGRWLQPGGHADGDLELAGVAVREASEETGIDGLEVLDRPVDLDVHLVDHGDSLGAHRHLDLRFVVRAPAGAELAPNHESDDIRWVAVGDLGAFTDERSVHRLVRLGSRAAVAASLD